MFPRLVYPNLRDVKNGRGFKENQTLKADFENQLTPPQAVVFLIDHILQDILSNLDRKTLLVFRFVCRRANYFASKELQKIVTLKFGITKTKTPRKCCFKINSNPENNPNLNPNRTFKKLTALIRKSPEFPCTSFLFQNPDAIYTQGNDFFSQNGDRLKKLELTEGDLNTPVYFEDLKAILLVKSPNLEILILDCSIVSLYEISLPFNWKISPPRMSFYDSHRNRRSSASDIRLNLKVLEFKRSVPEPEHLFHELLDASPKLTQVNLEENKDLHFLVWPVNRLYLMKSLKIMISSLPEALESQEILAQALAEGSNWTVRKLYFDGKYLRHMEHSLRPRASHAVSKILDCVAHSVKQVSWGDVECFGVAFQFPPMLRVKELVLSLHVYNSFSEQRLKTRRFYPANLCLEKIFPNLKTVSLVCIPDDPDIPVSFCRCKWMQNITRLIVYRTGTAQVVCFQELFPKAIILYKALDKLDPFFGGS